MSFPSRVLALIPVFFVYFVLLICLSQRFPCYFSVFLQILVVFGRLPSILGVETLILTFAANRNPSFFQRRLPEP